MNIKKIFNYILFVQKKIAFHIKMGKIPGEMKANYKNYIFYATLKQKYKTYIKTHTPVSNNVHEYCNKVWWCWFQGEEQAPELCKSALKTVRNNLPDKEIIIITEENYKNYANFPSFILKKYNEGKISRTHFSDLLRLELLSKYGGLWIDSTCFLTENPKFIFNKPLFVFQNRERGDSSIVASSWLISAEKNNPIILLTRDLLYNWWKEHNHLYHYFLLHFFFTMATEFYKDDWANVPFYSNLPCHVLQRELFDKYDEYRFEQLKKMSAVHKLTYKFGEKKLSETIYEYLMRN